MYLTHYVNLVGIKEVTDCKNAWSASFKIIDVQQAKLIDSYRNTKYKLIKTNAAIWYKKICRGNC
jgi:hypothetical protein